MMSTLARLSFWGPPEQIDDFESAYKRELMPILRKTIEGVFSRLSEAETPSEVVAKEHALRNHPAWQEVLLSLGKIFGTAEPGDVLCTYFRVDRTSIGPGGERQVPKVYVGAEACSV